MYFAKFFVLFVSKHNLFPKRLKHSPFWQLDRAEIRPRIFYFYASCLNIGKVKGKGACSLMALGAMKC